MLSPSPTLAHYGKAACLQSGAWEWWVPSLIWVPWENQNPSKVSLPFCNTDSFLFSLDRGTVLWQDALCLVSLTRSFNFKLL